MTDSEKGILLKKLRGILVECGYDAYTDLADLVFDAVYVDTSDAMDVINHLNQVISVLMQVRDAVITDEQPKQPP